MATTGVPLKFLYQMIVGTRNIEHDVQSTHASLGAHVIKSKGLLGAQDSCSLRQFCGAFPVINVAFGVMEFSVQVTLNSITAIFQWHRQNSPGG